MNKIYLGNLELKTFTEQDASDYCFLNNIKPLHIKELNLYNNELTDISGIKLFKNLEKLEIYNNHLTDISDIKLFKNLESLNIGANFITDISVLKDLKKLKSLDLWANEIKDISVLKNLKNLQWLDLNSNQITDISVLKDLKIKQLFIDNLELESDQIQYINKCKNLLYLGCKNGFKDMSALKELNKKINL